MYVDNKTLLRNVTALTGIGIQHIEVIVAETCEIPDNAWSSGVRRLAFALDLRDGQLLSSHSGPRYNVGILITQPGGHSPSHMLYVSPANADFPQIGKTPELSSQEKLVLRIWVTIKGPHREKELRYDGLTCRSDIISALDSLVGKGLLRNWNGKSWYARHRPTTKGRTTLKKVRWGLSGV